MEQSREQAWDELVRVLRESGITDGKGPIAERMAERVFTLPSYRNVDPELVRQGWLRNMSVSMVGMLEHRVPDEDDDDTPLRVTGESRARSGVNVAEMLQTAVQNQLIFMEIAAELAPESPWRDSLLLELFQLYQAWSAWGSAALAAGHRDAELEMQRRQQERQDNYVKHILLSGAAQSEIGDGAEAYGLDPDANYHAFRARLTVATDVRAVERYLHVAPSAGRRAGLMAIIDGDLCGFATKLPDAPAPMPIGISHAVHMEELASVFRLATRALETAHAIGREGIVGIDDLGLHAAVVADRDLAELMVARYLKPFEELGASGTAVLETVERYMDNNSALERTAKELYVHTNTVRYRLARFETVTGRSLRDTQTLVEVWWALACQRRPHAL
ncbi:PucR family transcriptional regulator [Solirubrobacter deserti]|uniref:Helix-turn-helix domain-containing protein n=1 Tax=Solirubrobacter deserti TaxID=2282478 RepID=A0ABT4RG05_9ACTN|nr:helix-turn-helix domain-containing protein [Solirubrobacter deserti]MDA0137463.1 helix-turn-helix domain-containing protein [Solirubrobacter deserti]